MPKTRGNFWSEYEVTVDSNGKEKYTCKTCSGTWSKNASRLKEHIEKCKDINVETETSQPQGTKRKRQQTFDEYKFAFTSKDQIILESLLIRAFTQRDHLNLDDRMKSLISSDTFWNDLGKIQNFLENFAIFIKKLGDETFLSTAYLEYQQLKAHVRNNTDLPENIREEVEKFGTNRWQNFLYNPVVIVAYKLDPRYCGSQLNARIFDPIIEKEILSLVGEEYKDI
ncbi:5378_t:CDS:2, partial [Rhizophagus irregularis]